MMIFIRVFLSFFGLRLAREFADQNEIKINRTALAFIHPEYSGTHQTHTKAIRQSEMKESKSYGLLVKRLTAEWLKEANGNSN